MCCAFSHVIAALAEASAVIVPMSTYAAVLPLQETSGSTPLFVLQAKLALSLDLLFFISSRSCSNYIKQRQLRLSQAASELGAAATTDAQPTLTLALIGKLPEAVEGWHPWRFLVKGSWVTSTFTTYEKAFAECLSMAYCQELLDDT